MTEKNIDLPETDLGSPDALDGERCPWLGKCHLLRRNAEVSPGNGERNPADNPIAECETVIAVWARDRKEFDTSLSTYLDGQGWRLLWSEEVSPATEWMAHKPHDRGAIDLARSVHRGRLVAHGPIIPVKDGATAAEERAFLTVEERDGIEPLDDQFGAHPRKTAPDDLYDPLFGKFGDGEDGGEDEVPPGSFAILDAAKITNLPELLAVSGLEYRCLFKGDAYEELKAVAPYIVELKDGNGFVRNLFTRTEAHWHHWDKEPGMYIRARASLDDLRAHFRKFTKVVDEDGKWYFLRFWDGMFFDYLASHKSGPFPGRFFAGLTELFHFSAGGRMVRVTPGAEEPPRNPAFMEEFKAFVAAKKRERFIAKAVSFLNAKYGADTDGLAAHEAVAAYYRVARAMDMKSELSAIKAIEAQYLCARAGQGFEEIDTDEIENYAGLSDVHRADALLGQALRLTGE